MKKVDIGAGGLVTVAYLQTKIERQGDNLGILMPLIIDTVYRYREPSFVAVDIQCDIERRHGILIPLQVIDTLLKRAVKGERIERKHGRYWISQESKIEYPNIDSDIERITERQNNLVEEYIKFSNASGREVHDKETGLKQLFSFFNKEQISILLGDDIENGTPNRTKSDLVVAKFIQHLAKTQNQLLEVIREILAGLVVYNSLFGKALTFGQLKLDGLKVVFDSPLVWQTLGWEGDENKKMMLETMAMLENAGAKCIVFEKSIMEIKRILAMLESKLGTSAGISSLRSTDLVRNFLVKRFDPQMIKTLSLLLEESVVKAGFEITDTPTRIPEFTAGEQDLTELLTNPNTNDETEPRVIHDVDCIAGVISFRKNKCTEKLKDSKSVFVTLSSRLVKNVLIWWKKYEKCTGICPAIHVRSITNYVWLSSPTQYSDYKLNDLIAICSTILKPSLATWKRFIERLEILTNSNVITNDEMSLIVVSGMTDELLLTAEIECADNDDIDANTFDQVVQRVKADYLDEFEHKLKQIDSGYAKEIEELKKQSKVDIERANRERDLALDSHTAIVERSRERAENLSVIISNILYFSFTVASALGAGYILFSHHFDNNLVGYLSIFCVTVFVLYEFLAVKMHLRTNRARLKDLIKEWYVKFLIG